MDPDLTVAAVAVWAARKADKVLDPSVDLVGEYLAKFTSYQAGRVSAFVRRAGQKLSDDTQQLPPRVLFTLMDDASVVDDEVMVEYLSGLLASSAGGDRGDDRAIAWASLIRGMSSSALRLHFLLYREWAFLLRGAKPDALEAGQRLADLVVGKDALSASLSVREEARGEVIVDSALRELNDATLIDSSELKQTQVRSLPGVTPRHVGIAFTGKGLQLYGWAMGKRDAALADFASSTLATPDLEGVSSRLPGARLAKPEGGQYWAETVGTMVGKSSDGLFGTTEAGATASDGSPAPPQA